MMTGKEEQHREKEYEQVPQSVAMRNLKHEIVYYPLVVVGLFESVVVVDGK